MRPAPVSQPAGPTTEAVSLHHRASTPAAPAQITSGARKGTALRRGSRWRILPLAYVVVDVVVMGLLRMGLAPAMGGQPHSPTSADLLKPPRPPASAPTQRKLRGTV